MRASVMRISAAAIAITALVIGMASAPAAAAGPAPAAAPGEAATAGMVQTADLSKFQPGNIVSDAVFFARSTMTEAQIQSFLQSKVSTCRDGYTCLKDYYDTSRSTSADAMCGAYSGGVRERASRIIYKVAQACGINPQVILVMLQKEQGLVTTTAPSSYSYRAAMGQGCPDTAACDTRYYGFFNQVYGGAWQLKRYANPAGTSQFFTWYAPGNTWNVLFHPNRACGTSPVYIQNQATANLYYYTPYQPNAAALRAGYGTGDGCSSYGNRNFFNYFSDWFGSTQVPTNACAQPSTVGPAVRAYSVTASVLNARVAPNSSCTTGVVKLSEGTVVQATASVDGWVKVDTEAGSRWVSREYVRFATSAEAVCALPGGVSTAKRAYVSTSEVIGRAVPTAACDSVLQPIDAGSIVQALKVSSDRNWVKVRTEAAELWVDRAGLRLATSAEAPCALPGGVSSAKNFYHVAAGGVTGRSAPSTACGMGAGALSAGTVIQAEAANADRDWLRAETGQGTLWIPRSKLVQTTSGEACSTPADIRAASRAYTLTDGVRASVAPSAACGDGAADVGTGAVVRPKAATSAGDWLLVALPGGDRWIPREAVRAATSAELCAAPADAKTAQRTYVMIAAGAGYAGPGATCTQTTTLPAGAMVTAVQATPAADWIQVGTPAGPAWMPRSNLRYASAAEICGQPSDARTARLTYIVNAPGATARLAPRDVCTTGAVQVAAGTTAVATAVTADGTWLKLTLPSGSMWMPRSAVSKVPTP
ncbi:MAG: hypothetical protein ACRCSL_02970 [Microbacterium sp.]